MSSIMEILGKIESQDGKVKFLEKCLFEEKNDENRSKILQLIHKLTRRRVSLESRMRQLEKEKIDSVVEEIAPPLIDKKIKKEPVRQVKTARLESALEDERRAGIMEEGVPGKSEQTKDYLAAGLNEKPKASGESQGYKQKANQESSYMREKIAPEATYRRETEQQRTHPEERHLPEEEYKRKEMLKVGKEKQKKEEDYMRKITAE